MNIMNAILPQRIVNEIGWPANKLGITGITRKELLAPTNS